MIISEIQITLKFLMGCLLIIIVSSIIGFVSGNLLFSMVSSIFGVLLFIIIDLIGIKLKEIDSSWERNKQ